MLTTINPATEETIQEYKPFTDRETEQIIENNAAQQKEWKFKTFEERAEIVHNISEELKNRKEEFAGLMANEMGKPLDQGIGEIEKCAWVCEFYADHAAHFLADEVVETDAQTSYINYKPLGVVLAVMPWNYPFWQVFRFIAPALMAGNTGLLKHAPNVTGCALAIEDVIKEAAGHGNLLDTLLIEVEQVEAVIKNDHVKAITLTGSTGAGSAVASQAGSEIKKTVLELGGSDPYLILEDADLEKAAGICAATRYKNAGQSCVAAKRFVVTEPVYDEFVERFVALSKEQRMGDPKDEKTDIGPQARLDLRDDLHKQVQESIDQGAECILGGEIPDQTGYFYPATVLTNLKPGMPAYDEELFGPVASIIKVKNADEAITVANDSPYGLGAAVFTEDLEKGELIAAEQLEAGCCFVNEGVKSDPRLPFGGVKKSGYGRELSEHGIREFTNIKTVYVA